MAMPTTGTEIILSPAPELKPAPLFTPTPKAARRVLEFFTGQINNDHTRKAYLNATRRFAAWCEEKSIGQLADVQPIHVAAFVKELQGEPEARLLLYVYPSWNSESLENIILQSGFGQRSAANARRASALLFHDVRCSVLLKTRHPRQGPALFSLRAIPRSSFASSITQRENPALPERLHDLIFTI
jgi:hypothetical protein